MAGLPVAGQDGAVIYQGVNMFLDEWSLTPAGGDINTYNYRSNQLDEGIFGKISVEGRIKGYFDIGQNPHADPVDFRAGKISGPLLIYPSVSANLFYNFPLIRVLTVPTNNQVEGRVEFEVTFKSQKIWYYPGNIAGNT